MYMRVCMYMCMRMRVLCVSVCLRVCMCVCPCVSVSLCLCVCVRVRVRTFTPHRYTIARGRAQMGHIERTPGKSLHADVRSCMQTRPQAHTHAHTHTHGWAHTHASMHACVTQKHTTRRMRLHFQTPTRAHAPAGANASTPPPFPNTCRYHRSPAAGELRHNARTPSTITRWPPWGRLCRACELHVLVRSKHFLCCR